MKTIRIPTGYIIIDNYAKGKLETLSIGDYGKEKNIKADFLGFNDEINGVPNGKIKSLSEKWVITLSTQYGCSMKCTFCDVPKVKFSGNASFDDLKKQFYNALSVFPDVSYTDRLNIHFARMGEPMFNFNNVYMLSRYLHKLKNEIQDISKKRIEVIHPVISTMVPKTKSVFDDIIIWARTKNDAYNGQAGLQLSINSTNEDQRKSMFNGKSHTLEDISKKLKDIPIPISRKYTLNFAIADSYETDGDKLVKLFDPEKWMVKITPIHNTSSCKENGIITNDGYNKYYPYKESEDSFKNAGFDVLVFIPSTDEEDGYVTCGNAVLSH